MGEACIVHGDDEKCVQNSGKRPKGRDHSEDLCIDWKIILKWNLKEIGWEVVAHNRDQWRALVNTVMNIFVP
jgi:hypothetical protein